MSWPTSSSMSRTLVRTVTAWMLPQFDGENIIRRQPVWGRRASLIGVGRLVANR
jgi:hypothetical protein